MTRHPWRAVGAVAVAATLGWLPFLLRPLSPDEAGYLIVASQWGPGSSLYGDFWVDRPPVLLGLYALADAVGDPAALRLLGTVAVVVTVLLAGLLGRVAVRDSRTAPLLTASTAAVFVATPLFGGSVTNSELFALPFVVAGLVAVVAACLTPHPRTAVHLAVAAGASGALAVLTKQSQVDVFVASLVLVLAARRWRMLVALVVGALATLGSALLVSHGLGTAPAELWEALVVFRGEAGQVVLESATSSTPRRLAGMLGALALSVAPVVAVALLVRTRRPAAYPGPDLRWPALAMLAWELFVVLGGGSYWLHYLVGLVPGLVLLAAAAAQRGEELRRALLLPYAAAGLSTLATIGYVLAVPIDRPEAPVIDYLEAEAAPGDTAVVAFGGANILRDTGMTSPYEELWSLPVRVRDPDLTVLTTVLRGADAPTWVVSNGRSLGTWGVRGTTADRVLADRYRLAAETGGFAIYRLVR